MNPRSTPQMQRVVPVPDQDSEPFWRSGADGQLRVQRCGGCGFFLHPPGPRCPSCGSRQRGFAIVSGRGAVYSCVVNHQQWHPSYPTPYVIASVELPEQDGLRIVSNIVGCAVDDVCIGLAVRAVFEQVGELYVPLFTPAGVS